MVNSGNGIWKSSQFNEYLGPLSNNQWVIYNNLTGAMIEIGSELYNSIKTNELSSLNKPEIIKNLIYAKFIVLKDMDEVHEIKGIREKYIRDVTAIGLQILPTTACCYQCSYCYQQPGIKPKIMSNEVAEAILYYLKKKIKSSTRYLNVMWFGGEPLLAIKRIRLLSRRFLEITDSNNIKYYAAMITNGYFLTEENIEILNANRVDFCQVTIDGPEKIHDSRRMLKNGGKTWKITMDNIKNAIAAGIKITVRMNIDKRNIDHIEEFAHVLRDYGLLNLIGISFGLVTSYGNICRSIEDTLLNLPHANEILEKKNIEALFDLKAKEPERSIPNFFGCVATAANSVIVGPEGELYKCSKNVGDLTERCGTIFQFDDSHPNFKKWLSCNPLEIESCHSCSLLPICNGTGCAFTHIVEKKNIFACTQEERHKKHIDKLIDLYWQKQHSNAKIK